MNPDPYYNRKEVSNSDLTHLKELLAPRVWHGDREAAFRFGSLVDAIVTEPHRVNHYRRMVDEIEYTEGEFRHALQMRDSLYREAQRDQLLRFVLDHAQTQRMDVRQGQIFHYGDLEYTLDTRCKWDWFLPTMGFGGDLKTTAAATQQEFDQAIEAFDWDRSRAWYMDIVGSDRDFIYGISKKNGCIFKAFIERGDEIYCRGREKYEELAFKYWCLAL